MSIQILYKAAELLQFGKKKQTLPNPEYISSQLAVNIMWYCRLKVAISLYCDCS